jgi:hypothetical protein
MTIPVGYSLVRLDFSGSGVPTGAVMTWGMNNPGLVTPHAMADVVANSLDTRNVKLLYDNSVNLSNIHVKNGPDATGPFYDRATVLPGERVGEVGYPGAAVLIKKSSASGGRKNQGRMYMPGICEGDIAIGGVIEASYLALCQATWNAIFGDLSGSGPGMVILHSGVEAPTVITGLNVEGQIATQRRRNRR